MNIQRDLFQHDLSDSVEVARHSLGEYWPSSISQTVSESFSNGVSTVQTQVSSSAVAMFNGANILLDSGSSHVERLSQSFVDRLFLAIAIHIQAWLEVHPLIAWMLHHPLLAMLGVLIVIFLLWSLLQTLLQLTQNLWAKILQLPLIFGMFVIRRIVAIIKPSSAMLFRRRSPDSQLEPLPPEHDPDDPQNADVIAMFIRLEELSREQNMILRQLTSRLQHQITEERSPQA
ncbi:MAG: hypothetical protein WBA57_10000 [Elainellaceae cyanobacterium]